MNDENDNDKVPTTIQTPELMQEGKESERANKVMEGSQLGKVLAYYTVELAQ